MSPKETWLPPKKSPGRSDPGWLQCVVLSDKLSGHQLLVRMAQWLGSSSLNVLDRGDGMQSSPPGLLHLETLEEDCRGSRDPLSFATIASWGGGG